MACDFISVTAAPQQNTFGAVCRTQVMLQMFSTLCNIMHSRPGSMACYQSCGVDVLAAVGGKALCCMIGSCSKACRLMPAQHIKLKLSISQQQWVDMLNPTLQAGPVLCAFVHHLPLPVLSMGFNA